MTILNGHPEKSLPPLNRKRRPWFALGISIAAFIGLQILLLLPRLGESNYHRGGWYTMDKGVSVPITVPFKRPLYKTGSMEIRTLLPATRDMSLAFNGLDSTAITAYLNDVEIYRVGDHGQPTANLWNSMVVIPLPDTYKPNNLFRLKLSGNHVIAANRLPSLVESSRALRKQSANGFLNSSLLMMAMGASIIIGVLLVGFSRQRGRKVFDGYLLGLSCFLVSVYAMEYTFRVSTGTLAVYGILKRMMISSGYLSSLTFLAGLDFQRNSRFTVSRWMTVPTAFSVVLIASAPNLGILFQWLIPLNIVLIVNMVVMIVVIFKDPKDRPLNLVAAGLIGMALIQLTVALPTGLSVPMVMQYSVLIAAIFFGLQFLLDFKAVFHERDSLRKSYNKDTLTDAYSRRALNDVNPGSFSSAVFLDLDEFKYYNDRYGHDKGDEVLKGFVCLAMSLLRQDDIVVRYGGDEFLILLKEADEKAVKGVVERIRRQFRNTIKDKNIDISYGISQIRAETGLDIKELDRKMYAMKQSRKQFRKLQLT